jgi:hypothetical protein
MKPTNGRLILFSAIKKEIRRPASLRASRIKISGSMNYRQTTSDGNNTWFAWGAATKMTAPRLGIL